MGRPMNNFGLIQLDKPDQVGIVVNNVVEMVEQFKNLFGIAGFEIIDWPLPDSDPESTYHGKPSFWRMRTAFATLGSLQIELVEPLEGNSIYKDFLLKNGPGLHHFRFTVQDFDDKVKKLEDAGIKMISSGRGMRTNSRWAYFDTFDIFNGVYIELRTV
jgi:methylmalonyl-CoA/ethylmalonyl-CoA epimerase